MNDYEPMPEDVVELLNSIDRGDLDDVEWHECGHGCCGSWVGARFFAC